MHALRVLGAAALALLASPVRGRATQPSGSFSSARDWQSCLCYDDASYLVNSYALLLNSTFDATLAADIISPTVEEFSDSINFLAGIPYGAATFSGLAVIEGGIASQPPMPFEVLSIDAVTCTTVAYRWLAYPSPAGPVRGITIFYATLGTNTANGANGWEIQTQFVEFNSAQWVLDIGGTCVP